ncbi:MAG: NAD(P)-binding domain-containing protein [Pseudomonadales bacterium]
MNEKKRVCVIGAGASGLVATKELVDAGHEVTCYEKHDKIAGVFYYSAAKSGTYDSTKLTVSNYFMAYSSFPPADEEIRKYWTWKEYADYLQGFVNHFDLASRIKLKYEVKNIQCLDDDSVLVQIEKPDGAISEVIYDHVAVCTGTNQNPKKIAIVGLETFTGSVEHSAYYKNAAPYAGKSVLCIGAGETGADVVDEISRVANECTLSLRHYQPLTERFPYGRKYTNDAFTSYALYAVPSKLQNWLVNIQFRAMQMFSKNPVVKEYARWNLVAGDYFNHFFTKTEGFLKGIIEKRIHLHVGGIARIESDTVFFQDGTSTKADVIMMNTGYHDKFDFLPSWEGSDMRSLDRHMIDPKWGKKIVFIGWARPGVGGVPACSEMQSRYFAMLCAGKLSLPDAKGLAERIDKQKSFEDKMYRRSPGIKTLVHYSSYIHDLSKIVGCSPWRWATFLNPRLLYKLWFGSQLPYIYRLYGENNNHQQAKSVIYRLSNATNPFENCILVILAIVGAMFTRLRFMEGDV